MTERIDGSKISKQSDELMVITKAFDLAREMTQRTRKLPRDLKFVLGDQMLTTTYDVLDTLLEVKYVQVKKALLQHANLLLERLCFQVRLCVEEKLISIRQYEYVIEMIDEVGRMVGGRVMRVRIDHGCKTIYDTAACYRQQPWLGGNDSRGTADKRARMLRGGSWNNDNPDNFRWTRCKIHCAPILVEAYP